MGLFRKKNVFEATITSVAQAQQAIKELKQKRKELALAKRRVMERQRVFRAEYTDRVRRRGSKVRGGGGVGGLVRAVQTMGRDVDRATLAKNLEPLEKKRQEIDKDILAIDRGLMQLEGYISDNLGSNTP